MHLPYHAWNWYGVYASVTRYVFCTKSMKTLKVYLFVVCALLITAISFGVYVWYTVQKVQKEIDAGIPPVVEKRNVLEDKSGTRHEMSVE